MKRTFIGATLPAILAAIFLLFNPVKAVSQATATTDNTYEAFSLVLTPTDFPCVSEDVILDGTLHLVEHTTFNASGGRNVKILFNAPAFTAVGDPSGTIYRITGPTHLSVIDDDPATPPRVRSLLDVIHVIGPGDADDMLVWTLFSVTRDASGELRAFVDIERIECH
jgi:hypothetical protein